MPKKKGHSLTLLFGLSRAGEFGNGYVFEHAQLNNNGAIHLQPGDVLQVRIHPNKRGQGRRDFLFLYHRNHWVMVESYAEHDSLWLSASRIGCCG